MTKNEVRHVFFAKPSKIEPNAETGRIDEVMPFVVYSVEYLKYIAG
ncbi:MAG TPA: hypothetical protein PKV75_09750 [Desulfobacterales bacterium]|nr:hypothetical protein [Desulfobacterales bacterium]